MGHKPPEPLRIEGGVNALLEACAAYDHLESMVAIFDAAGNLKYANSAFTVFNHTARDSAAGLDEHDALLECPRVRSWLKTAVSAGCAEAFNGLFFTSLLINADLTLCLRPVLAGDGRAEGFLMTLADEAIRFNGQHIARYQASLATLAERIRSLNIEKLGNDRLIRILFKDAPFAMILSDGRSEVIQINHMAEWIFGYSNAEVVGMPYGDLVLSPVTDGPAPRGQMQQGHEVEVVQACTRDHATLHLLRRVVVHENDDHGKLVISSFVDITERKRDEESLRIAAVTFESQDAILITDQDAKILRVNRAFQEITGYRADEVVGQTPGILKSGWHDAAFYRAMWSQLRESGKWSGEIIDRRKNGDIYPKSMSVTAIYDDQNRLTHYVAVFRDVSLARKSEEEIHQLAFYDPLTRLPNRRLLLDRLKQAMAGAMRHGRLGALLVLDLDNFKTINATQGHAVGDKLLVEVAHRLQRCLRELDSAARMGGDEFVVLLEDLSAERDAAATQAELVAEKIRNELSQPYHLHGDKFHSTTSIGINLFSGHDRSVEELLMQADVAMYQAKAAGRNAIRFFDPAMQIALDRRAVLEADLRQALEQQQFHLYFQTQVNSLCRPIGAEVLLRWKHPVRGLVSPSELIPLAEETGLIMSIGSWILEEACVQLTKWQDHAQTRNLTLSVNVSARQFKQPDFVTQVQRVLTKTGANPAQLTLELTESILLEDVEDTIDKMREIKKLGVSFSLDDFGTGYSSLFYLKRLPLDHIKIDRSFVHDIADDPNDATIVQTIIAMSEILGLNVIAEGVETEEQFEFLEMRGCKIFQGYLFGKPTPLGEFEKNAQLPLIFKMTA